MADCDTTGADDAASTGAEDEGAAVDTIEAFDGVPEGWV